VRHRDYSATLGRWTQTDPIGFDAGDTNLYRFVGNGPVNAVDPSGLEESFGNSGWWPWNWLDDTIDDAQTIINAGSTVDDNFNRNVGYRWDPFDPNAPIVTHAGIIYPGGKPLTKDTAKLCQTAAEYGAAAGGSYGPGIGIKRGGIPKPKGGNPKKSGVGEPPIYRQPRDPKTGQFVPDPERPKNTRSRSDSERRKNWKAIAEDPNSPLDAAQRCEVKNRGWRGPQRINSAGELETMELSHEPIPFRDGGIKVVPRWPADHAARDQYRRLKN